MSFWMSVLPTVCSKQLLALAYRMPFPLSKVVACLWRDVLSQRVANAPNLSLKPPCLISVGFNSVLHPLVKAGLIHSISTTIYALISTVVTILSFV